MARGRVVAEPRQRSGPMVTDHTAPAVKSRVFVTETPPREFLGGVVLTVTPHLDTGAVSTLRDTAQGGFVRCHAYEVAASQG